MIKNGVPLQYQKSLPMEARSDAQNPRPNIMLSWNPVHYNNQMTQLLGAVSQERFEYVVNYVNETQTYFSYQAVRVESFGLVEYAVVVEALERSDSSVALYSPNVCEEDMNMSREKYICDGRIYMGIQSETSVTVQQQIVPDDMMAKTMKHDEVRVPAKVDLKVERFRCAWMGDLTFDCGHGPHVGQMRFHCSIKKKGRLWAGELRFDCGNGGGCFRWPTMKGIGGKRRYRQPRMGVKGKREARGLTTRKRLRGSLRLSREMETEILENRKRFTWAEKGKWKPVENTDTSDHHSLDPLMEETNKDSGLHEWECVKVIEKRGEGDSIRKLPIHSAVTSVPLQASHKKRRRDDDTY
ncbi:hypothetical protein BC829DRAFT_393637, partial [Chytridium lagenaria]